MKVSSQVLSIAILAGCVAANERGRQNDWHKVTKPNKFKPNAPRNEGKVLREDRKAAREANAPVVNDDSEKVKEPKPEKPEDFEVTGTVEELLPQGTVEELVPQSTASLDLSKDYPSPKDSPSGGIALFAGSTISALVALLFF